MRPLTSAFAASLVATALLTASAALAAPPPNAPGSSVQGSSVQAGSVQASDAWARASAGAATTGAAYVSLTAGQDDRLVSVSTPAAKTAEVHESTSEGGVMRMRPVTGGVALPAGKAVALSPGGYHIMMFGLQHPLKAGERFPLTLSFAHAAPVTVTATVRPIGAAAMGGSSMGGSMGGMDHGSMGGMHMDHGSPGGSMGGSMGNSGSSMGSMMNQGKTN